MNILEKLKLIIRNFFSQEKRLKISTRENETQADIVKNNRFNELLKEDTKNHFNKNEIIDELEKNPNLIYKLSYTRLVQLNQLYDEKIKELEKRLELCESINK